MMDNWVMRWVGLMLAAVCDVLCGVISFCTLTIYRPMWDMDIRVYFQKKQLNARKRKMKGELNV